MGFVQKKSIFITAAALAQVFYTARAGAVTEHPEILWQPEGGESSLTLTPAYVSGEQKTKFTKPTVSSATWETKGWMAGLGFQHGFSENLAFETRVAYSRLTLENTETSAEAKEPEVKRRGWSNIEALLKYYTELSPRSMDLYLGLHGSISPSRAQDTNFFTGGHSVEPYIALSISQESLKFGPRVAYQYAFDRKFESNGLVSTLRGGNVLTPGLFAEYQAASMALGAEIDYAFTSQQDANASTPSASGGSVSTSANSTYSFDSYQTWLLKAYGRFSLSPSFDIIPAFNYSTRATDGLINGDLVTTTPGAAPVRTTYASTVELPAWTLSADFRLRF